MRGITICLNMKMLDTPLILIYHLEANTQDIRRNANTVLIKKKKNTLLLCGLKRHPQTSAIELQRKK